MAMDDDEPVPVPIEDVIDLHAFHPRDIPDLLEHWIAECARRGFSSVRVIHGKGTGRQKLRVQTILSRHPRVRSFRDAPAEAGGWGATLVELDAGPSRRG